MQWSRERCKINLIIVARDYNNTMVVNYIYIVLQSHWKGFGMYSFFYILFWRHSVYVYVCIMYIYVCVCVCIWYAVCACVYLYIYIYMCVCVCVYIYIYVWAIHVHSRRCFFYRQWYFESYNDEIRNITVDGGQCTAVQIIRIWKWKQNVWREPCHAWI